MKQKTIILLLLATPLLLSQSNKLTQYDKINDTFYYLSSEFSFQAARIELEQPINLNRIEFNLNGECSGRFDLDIFGHEGGASRPVLKTKLLPTKTLTKTSSGIQKFVVNLEEPIKLDNDYFFIQLSNFEDEMGLICDSTFVDQCNPNTEESNVAPLVLQDCSEEYEFKWVNPQVKLNYTTEHIQNPFFKENITLYNPSLIYPNQPISWEDVNNDNWIDLLIGNYLWINNSTSFDKPKVFDLATKHSFFIDFDNDYDTDILFFGWQGTSLFLNDSGKFKFAKKIDELHITNPQAICIADVNNDRYPDVLVGQLWSKYPMPLPNFLLENQNGDSLIDISSRLYPYHDGKNNFPYNRKMIDDPDTYDSSPNENLNKRSRAAQFIDFDQDGDQDLYIANYFLEEDELFENKGNGEFTLKKSPVDSIVLMSPTCHDNYFNHGTGISWSDFDNDGDFDFIISQLAHPQLILGFGHLGTTLFENVGNSWKQIENNANIRYEESHAGVVFGDINNDGLEDLVIAAYYDCRYLDVYLQNDDHTFDLQTFESGLNKISGVYDVCLVDYNNDGKLDISFINDGTIKLYENQINNSNNWLKVRLKGKTINSQGIGTIVSVHCKDKIYTKQLSSGRGQSMQSPNILHYGISDQMLVDSIEVQWNKNKKQILNNIAVNQLIEIEEI